MEDGKKPPRKPQAKKGDLKQAGSVQPMSAEEANAAFAHTVTPEIYLAIYKLVLERWRFRCAITGRRFRLRQIPHPSLEVVAIRPLAAGGPLHVSNFLPLTREAAAIFEDGNVIVGDDFQMWSSLATMGSHVLGRIVPLGQMLLPENEAEWPDRAQLRWHRERVLGPYIETA